MGSLRTPPLRRVSTKKVSDLVKLTVMPPTPIHLLGDPSAAGTVSWTPEGGPRLDAGTLPDDVATAVRAYLSAPIPVPNWDDGGAPVRDGATDGFSLTDTPATVDPRTPDGFRYALDALLDHTPYVVARGAWGRVPHHATPDDDIR